MLSLSKLFCRLHEIPAEIQGDFILVEIDLILEVMQVIQKSKYKCKGNFTNFEKEEQSWNYQISNFFVEQNNELLI